MLVVHEDVRFGAGRGKGRQAVRLPQDVTMSEPTPSGYEIFKAPPQPVRYARSARPSEAAEPERPATEKPESRPHTERKPD